MADQEVVAEAVESAPAHPYHYIVAHPFAQYQRGDLISDADALADLLSGDNVHHCVRVLP